MNKILSSVDVPVVDDLLMTIAVSAGAGTTAFSISAKLSEVDDLKAARACMVDEIVQFLEVQGFAHEGLIVSLSSSGTSVTASGTIHRIFSKHGDVSAALRIASDSISVKLGVECNCKCWVTRSALTQKGMHRFVGQFLEGDNLEIQVNAAASKLVESVGAIRAQKPVDGGHDQLIH